MTLSKPNTATRPTLAGSRVLSLLAIMLGLVACDAELEIANAAPRVTWVAVQPPIDGEAFAEITVWVADVEGDPVDLTLEVVADGKISPLILQPSGHGLMGLTTQDARFDSNGQPHLLVWDVTGLSDAEVQLRFQPDDQVGGTGATVITPPFKITDGLKEAVTVQVTD